MIKPSMFYDELISNGINYFSGVPDSLLKDICAYITDNAPKDNHLIASNEGAAVGIAVGRYLASGEIPLVYMQNSGLGNTVNPILSIADDLVYSIPMIMLVGWRGEPGIKDEPQHIRQGAVSEDLLQAMKIPYEIMDSKSNVSDVIQRAVHHSREALKPFAILVKKGTFESYSLQDSIVSKFQFNREEAVKLIIDSINPDDVIVSTTGKTSREIFEYRESLGQGHDKDFLTVGAMGHTSAIALGIAQYAKNRRVLCIDGDGSVIMHMGTLAVNGVMKEVNNFKHIVVNNGAHDSVGGQPTVGFDIDFVKIANGCGYTWTDTACELSDIKNKLRQMIDHSGRSFLEIKVNKGARKDLGRPTSTPKENKLAFQSFLK